MGNVCQPGNCTFLFGRPKTDRHHHHLRLRPNAVSGNVYRELSERALQNTLDGNLPLHRSDQSVAMGQGQVQTTPELSTMEQLSLTLTARVNALKLQLGALVQHITEAKKRLAAQPSLRRNLEFRSSLAMALRRHKHINTQYQQALTALSNHEIRLADIDSLAFNQHLTALKKEAYSETSKQMNLGHDDRHRDASLDKLEDDLDQLADNENAITDMARAMNDHYQRESDDYLLDPDNTDQLFEDLAAFGEQEEDHEDTYVGVQPPEQETKHVKNKTPSENDIMIAVNQPVGPTIVDDSQPVPMLEEGSGHGAGAVVATSEDEIEADVDPAEAILLSLE